MWSSMWYKLSFIVLSLVISSNAQQSTPVVDIPEQGLVQGSVGYTSWTNRTIHQFHAIPYAESPVGVLRFQIFGEFVNVDNEDCLTLSVFTNDLNASRPVMVHIHGGGFFVGGAGWLGPGYLLESDIVLVVIQYRLGPLGFLSMLNEKIPGNVGILDTIAALEWVQQYIGHFGGNSSQVTIFGVSAGAAAVSALLHSPLVQGRSVPLFQRAILQSGSVFAPWALCETPVEGTFEFAKLVGCNETDTEQCLQEASVKSLLEVFNDHRAEEIKMYGLPCTAGSNIVVGGPSGLFPKHPKNYLWNATENIAVMGGTTSQDGLFLLDEIVQLHPESLNSLNSSHDLLQFIQMLHEIFGQGRVDGVLEGYAILQQFLVGEVDRVEWEEIVPGLTDICSNHGIKGPVLTDIQAFSRVNPENVYLYSFDYAATWTEVNVSFPFPFDGVVQHAEDLMYLFPLANLTDADTKVAKMMVELWTSFATSGIPSSKDTPYWPPANKLYGPYLKIDKNSEERRYYLNEFTATSNKFRMVASGGGRTTSAIVVVALLALSKVLI